MARIPDKAEMQRRFMALDIRDRRRIIRAVNRGQAVDDRKLAVPAVGVARRQQRFWKWAWLLGPFIGPFQALFPGVTLQGAALNSVVATLLMVGLSWFWLTRARRSERDNLALAGVRAAAPSSADSPSRDQDGTGSGRRGRSHLPGRSNRSPSGSGSGGGEGPDGGVDAGRRQDRSSDRRPPPGQRPYKGPRGRKRG